MDELREWAAYRRLALLCNGDVGCNARAVADPTTLPSVYVATGGDRGEVLLGCLSWMTNVYLKIEDTPNLSM